MHSGIQDTVREDAALATRSGSPRLRVVSLSRDAGEGMGGAEWLAYEFARRLDPARFERYLCITREPEQYRTQQALNEQRMLQESGVKVLCLGRRSSFSMLPWTRLHRLLVRERIDVVHAHMPRASVPGSILARLAGVPIVLSHEHGSLLDGKSLRPFLDRNVVARLSTVILAVSEWDRQQMIERERVPAERVRVFANGIYPLPDGPPAAREDLGATPDLPLIGAIGRLYDQKGYDYLIRAVALLKARGRALRCAIAGVGPDEHKLKQLVSELGVDEEIRWIGHRLDVPAVVRAFDVAVLPSRWEGSPLALMEYMALGAPIVATAVGGVPELIEDGVHGLLVPPRDPASLADAIERLLQDRTLAASLGRAAQERQHAEHDLDTQLARLERLYLELHAQSQRDAAAQRDRGGAERGSHRG